MSLLGHGFTVWLRGLLATVISGASGGALTALATVGIDPEHFNFTNGLGDLFKLAGAAAVIMGFIALLAYLKQSPIPQAGDSAS